MKQNHCLICKKKTSSWYCSYHLVMKEANYALNDLEPLKKWRDKKTKKEFQTWAIKRLINFAKFIIDENDWGRKLT